MRATYDGLIHRSVGEDVDDVAVAPDVEQLLAGLTTGRDLLNPHDGQTLTVRQVQTLTWSFCSTPSASVPTSIGPDELAQVQSWLPNAAIASGICRPPGGSPAWRCSMTSNPTRTTVC
jgi:hypothetical protein